MSVKPNQQMRAVDAVVDSDHIRRHLVDTALYQPKLLHALVLNPEARQQMVEHVEVADQFSRSELAVLIRMSADLPVLDAVWQLKCRAVAGPEAVATICLVAAVVIKQLDEASKEMLKKEQR